MIRASPTTACDRRSRVCNRYPRRVTSHRPVKALLDPYNPVGYDGRSVNFTTSKQLRRRTSPERCHVNWAVCDSGWEMEFCRVAETHPKVRAYVKNQGLGLEVPYRFEGVSRIYRPDFIVLVDDGRGEDDLLHLIVEIKGFRGEDAKDKADTMEQYWVPAVNRLGTFGRWDFAEFQDVYAMQADFATKVDGAFSQFVNEVVAKARLE